MNIYWNKRSGFICPWSGLLFVTELSIVLAATMYFRTSHPGTCIKQSRYVDLIALHAHVSNK